MLPGVVGRQCCRESSVSHAAGGHHEAALPGALASYGNAFVRHRPRSNVRNVVAAALLALVAAGCLWLGDEVAQPPEALDWHLSSTVIHQEGFCGDCHYGLTEFWLADWEREQANWTLTVRPRYAEAPLYAVQVGADAVLHASGWQEQEWSEQETRTITFDVADADHVLFKAFGSGPQHDALDASATRRDVVETALVLTAPDGTRHEATGPEDDLRIVVAPAQHGTWQARVTFVAGAFPEGRLLTYHELLRGEVVERLDPGQEATFRFPASETGAPPATMLRVQPHHDHAAFQNTDWDPYDSTWFEISFDPQPGVAPAPRTWNQTEVEAMWDGREAYLMHTMQGAMRAAYVDEPGHNDPGAGSSYPDFQSPDGLPVLPGTDHLRFELTWHPPVAEPDVMVKFSPAQWPYFIYPEADERSPGRAVFRSNIAAMWWEAPDQTLEWYEPGVVRSHYDIAPYIREDGEAHVVALDYELRVHAVRGSLQQFAHVA